MTDKIQQQHELERESVELGASRYRNERMPWNPNAKKAGKEETELAPGKMLLNRSVTALATAIEEWIEKAAAGGAGRRHGAVKYLKSIDPVQAAYIAARTAINSAVQRTALQAVCMTIAKRVEEHIDFQQFAADAPGLYRFTKNKLAKSTSARHKTVSMRQAMTFAETPRLAWTVRDRLSLGTKLLELMIEATALLEKVKQPTRNGRHVYILQPTDTCADWLEKQHARCELLAPVYLPMIVPPGDWRTPYSGGYLSGIIKARMVKTRNRAYLDELGSVDMPEVYDAVNSVQRTAWRINKPVLDVLRLVWESGDCLGGLPQRENSPLPAKPLDIETNEPARRAWKAEAAKTHEDNARLRSKRLAVSQKLWIGERFADEEEIFFPHQVDFRGRVYPMVPFVNPQADDSGKALLEFAEGKPLGEDGAFWLAVHIANLFGVDKVTFAERVQWVFDNEEVILDSAFNPLDGQRYWSTADSPYCALAACFEWAGYKMEGDAYVSRLPIALDGSCSGLQHYSAVLRDPVGGKAVNVVPSETPQDIYSEVARVAQDFVDASGDKELAAWKGGKVNRKIAKQPCMTFCYASTRYGMQKMIESALRKLDEENRAVGEGPHLNGADNYEAARALSHVIYSSIGEVVVAASTAMDWLKEAARISSDAGLPVYWTTPTGFPVLQEYKRNVAKRYVVHFGGERIDLTLTNEAQKIDKKSQANGIAPNWVHSLDASHLMKTVNACVGNGINSLCLIHDSFATHAGSTSELAYLLREQFVDQYSVDVLAQLRDELAEQLDEEEAAKLPPLPTKGTLELQAVMDSEFFFA